MHVEHMDEHACAVLSLSTKLAWAQGLPQPLPRTVVRRMLETGALKGLVLRSVPGIEEKWLERASTLLSRVSHVYDGIETYKREGYRLLFPGRKDWPQALHALGMQMPLFLFAKGNRMLLRNRMISVAGSRRILRQTWEAAQETGRMIAREGMVLVTGGAQGVDSAAQCGALTAGGGVVLIPALPAVQLLRNPETSAACERGQLLILCDSLPDDPFSAAKALSRNHTIYALGEAGLVIAAREGRGGSWRGAADCMRGGWRPVYVWDGVNADTKGNCALEGLGAGAYTLKKSLGEQMNSREQTSLFDGV